MQIEKEALYKERVKRIEDVVKLNKPDRVPFVPFFSFFPANYYGINCEQYMHDYEKMKKAAGKTNLEFEPDQYLNPFGLFGLGRVMGLLDFKPLKLPGHGVSPESTYQFVEEEIMKPEEYDDYLSDPTDFILRCYLPRTCGALESLKMLPNFPSLYYLRIPRSAVIFGIPEVVESLRVLLEAGKEAQTWASKAAEFAQEMKEQGFPPMFGGSVYAPFDYFGDNFRGTKGIMLDMYRCPNKLIMALEKVLPILAKSAISEAKQTGIPYIFMPLHKGLDGFMSLKQFEVFYWPTLRALMMELIKNDLVPCPLWEGKCNSRLEIIKDIPAGKAVYHFEQTDIFKAKEILGDRVCIRGNVPASMLITGTPEQVRDYCKKLIDCVGKNGGFIMDGSIGIPDEAKPENLKAMEKTTKEYGIYS